MKNLNPSDLGEFKLQVDSPFLKSWHRDFRTDKIKLQIDIFTEMGHRSKLPFNQ